MDDADSKSVDKENLWEIVETKPDEVMKVDDFQRYNLLVAKSEKGQELLEFEAF